MYQKTYQSLMEDGEHHLMTQMDGEHHLVTQMDGVNLLINLLEETAGHLVGVPLEETARHLVGVYWRRIMDVKRHPVGVSLKRTLPCLGRIIPPLRLAPKLRAGDHPVLPPNPKPLSRQQLLLGGEFPKTKRVVPLLNRKTVLGGIRRQAMHPRLRGNGGQAAHRPFLQPQHPRPPPYTPTIPSTAMPPKGLEMNDAQIKVGPGRDELLTTHLEILPCRLKGPVLACRTLTSPSETLSHNTHLFLHKMQDSPLGAIADEPQPMDSIRVA